MQDYFDDKFRRNGKINEILELYNFAPNPREIKLIPRQIKENRIH